MVVVFFELLFSAVFLPFLFILSDFRREITEKGLKYTKRLKQGGQVGEEKHTFKKTSEKSSSTSFWVPAGPKSWSKYTTSGYQPLLRGHQILSEKSN